MGKATIQSGSVDGKYQILYHLNKTRMEARIATLAENIQTAESVELPVLEAALASVEAAILGLEGQLNTAINSNDIETILGLTSYLSTARLQRDSAKSEVSRKKAEILSLRSQKSFLENNLPADPSIEAWCADMNVSLSGDVGTIEVPGERTHAIIIKPGGESGSEAAYIPGDGQMTPVLGLSPEENFYNLAMLPGWQKWQPKYRVATITAIDNGTDTCDLVLDAAVSSQKDEGGTAFNVDSTHIYADVPVEYMSCNSSAFNVGDKVVVKFTTPTTPKVIGFESNPQTCFLIKLKLRDHNGDVITKRYIGNTPGEDISIQFGALGYMQGELNVSLLTLMVDYDYVNDYWLIKVLDSNFDGSRGLHLSYRDNVEYAGLYTTTGHPPLRNLRYGSRLVDITMPGLLEVRTYYSPWGGVLTSWPGTATLEYRASDKHMRAVFGNIDPYNEFTEFGTWTFIGGAAGKYLLPIALESGDWFPTIVKINPASLPLTDSSQLNLAAGEPILSGSPWIQYPGRYRISQKLVIGDAIIFAPGVPNVIEDTLPYFWGDISFNPPNTELNSVTVKSGIDYVVLHEPNEPTGFFTFLHIFYDVSNAWGADSQDMGLAKLRYLNSPMDSDTVVLDSFIMLNTGFSIYPMFGFGSALLEPMVGNNTIKDHNGIATLNAPASISVGGTPHSLTPGQTTRINTRVQWLDLV